MIRRRNQQASTLYTRFRQGEIKLCPAAHSFVRYVARASNPRFLLWIRCCIDKLHNGFIIFLPSDLSVLERLGCGWAISPVGFSASLGGQRAFSGLVQFSSA